MAGLSVEEIFGESLKSGKLLEAFEMRSILKINKRDGSFNTVPLDYRFQFAPVNSFLSADFNGDGIKDLLAGGNFYGVLPFEGRYDGMMPALLINMGNGDLKYEADKELMKLSGEVRDMKAIRLAGNRRAVLVARNNESLQLLEY